MTEPTTSERDDLLAATEALSTAESVTGDVDEVRRPPVSARGFLAVLRKGWRQLTTMRTALLLLFLLALAAVPGSLFPQRGIQSPAVDRFYADHTRLAPVLDRLGMFDVFGSTWFYTLYALLAVSLVGCLIPRIRLHARSSVARPPRPPRHFDHLPASTTFETSSSPDDAIAAAHSLLRSRRWRTDRSTTAGGSPAVAAEKGYLRETGNLVFHVSLLVLLASVALGALLGYKGVFAVIEGQSFTNTWGTLLYDDFTPGQWVGPGDIPPFTVKLDDFRARYLPSGEPAEFHADVHWAPRVGARTRHRDIQVNHPLKVGGAKVYLLGSGFAPHFVVRDKAGTVVYDDYVPFLPQKNANQLSAGLLKVPYGLPYDVGMRAAFFPTFATTAGGAPYSSWPEAKVPVLTYELSTGDLDLARPQTVYQMYEEKMTKVGDGVLFPGRSIALPGGASLTFADFREYAVFQTTRNPGTRPAFAACVAGLLGLIASLFVRRRRVWVRATPSAGGTVVAVGGLSRHDTGRFQGEFATLARDLSARVSTPAPTNEEQ
jgi:cytochrome c biogenesis protein